MKLLKRAITISLFGVCLMVGYLHGRHIPTYAGPYRVVLNWVTNISDEIKSTGQLSFRLHTTQVRGRQPQYGWGDSNLTVPINDKMKFEVRLAVRSNNQWKKNAFVFPFDRACSNMLQHGMSIVELVYGQKYTECPLPALGYRPTRNHSFEAVFPHFPIIPYGRYLFSITVTDRNTIVGVGLSDLEVVPRV